MLSDCSKRIVSNIIANGTRGIIATENKRFAIFIDADNISDKYVKTIFDKILKEGEATIRRMYGV